VVGVWAGRGQFPLPFLIGPKIPHTCGNLSPVISIIMCVIIDLILVLTPMPMPYYIFPSAFSEPETRRGDALSASLLHPAPPLPSTALLRCTASCALDRGPVCEGVAAGWRASQTARRTAFASRACSHNWTRGAAPLCVPQGFNTGVLSPSAPASCCSGSSPEFR
jgi:hypothetical protein